MTIQTSQVIQHLRRTVLLQDGAGLTDGQLLGCFIEQRDEAAFAALVKRHGPMVYGVCRRLLAHHDAEDAFQAAFLVLARKASSVVPREVVGNWLYGVAHQTALQARRAAARRGARERQVADMPEPAVTGQEVWDDLQPLLDQELSRLPDKYRAVIVLCDLEGKPRREVARQLGCPEGTVAGRLARARAMLAKRLTQRGVALSGGVLAAVLAREAASAGVPSSVVSGTIKAASLFAAGGAVTTGVIPVHVAALTEGVLKTMLLNKLRSGVTALLVLAVIGLGGGLLKYGTAAAQQGKLQAEVGERDQPFRTETVPGTQAQRSSIAFRDQPAVASPVEDKGEAAVKKELAKLQGTWTGVGGEFRGKETPEEDARRSGHRLVISGDTFAWSTALQEEPLMKGTVRIDPSKRPKAMYLSFDQAGKPRGQCIYELDGDTLKLCYGEPDRPTEFKTRPGSDDKLYVWQRQKN